MFTNPNLDDTLTKLPHEREEIFPMQEQDQHPVANLAERSAAEIYKERLAEIRSGIYTPVFIP